MYDSPNPRKTVILVNDIPYSTYRALIYYVRPQVDIFRQSLNHTVVVYRQCRICSPGFPVYGHIIGSQAAHWTDYPPGMVAGLEKGK